MDLYLGRQLAPGAVQTHDLNPGVAPSGLFWTMPASAGSVSADPVAGTASYTATDLDIGEYFNIPVGANNGPHVPAKVSFTITWSPGPSPKMLHPDDAKNTYRGEFVQGIATASWSMSEDGFSFASDAPATTKTVQAEVGTERNGKFFAK
jgi:hypothetical protein